MVRYVEVATPDGADVYVGGGVITTFRYGAGDGAGSELVANGTTLRTPIQVGARLHVYAPPAGVKEIEVRVGGRTARKLAVVAAPAALAAPKLKTVSSNAPKPRRTRAVAQQAIDSTQMIVTLTAAPPDDAFALLAYVGRSKTTMPRAWIPVQKGVTAYTVQTGGKACAGGTADPTFVGDHLRFAWLDRGGRVSAMSTMLRVAKHR
ncbi:MAG TPA: hypothetical protein VIV11_29250 [Kofleriaceae bacterium]